MINALKSFFVLSLLVTMSACEGGTTFTKSLTNNTSETITLSVFSSSEREVTIAPDETKSIWMEDHDRRFAGDDYTCVNELDSILVSVSNNKILLLDLMDSNNWMLETSDGRNATANCTITISEEDLQ